MNYMFLKKICKFKMSGIINVIALSLLFLPASDRKLYYPAILRIIAFIVIIIPAFRNSIRNKKIYIKKEFQTYLVFWSVLILGVVFSAIVNGDMMGVQDYIIVFLFYFILIPQTTLTILDLAIASVVVDLYVVYRCYTTIGVYFKYYGGTTINSNQFAMIMIGGCLSAVFLVFKAKSKLVKLVMIPITILLFSFMSFSSSRTSVATFAICAIVIFVHQLFSNFSIKNTKIKINHKYRIWAIGALLVLICCIVVNYKKEIQDFFLNKWNSVDILSGRSEIWRTIFGDIHYFGNHFNNINANSDSIECLKLYGIIPFVFYLGILLSTLLFVVKKYFKEKTIDNIFCVSIVICFIVLGLFEIIFAAFGKPINIMFWCICGFLVQVNKD